MPRDQGAPAPRTLTQWVEHLKRTRIAAKKSRSVVKRRQAATQRRLREAETLISQIIDGVDIIGYGAAPEGDGASYPAAYLLLTLHTAWFNDLAIFGSELEDLEDGGDAEPTEADEGEPDLGRSERLQQPEERGSDDAEPSLGATQMVDQRRWHEGPVTDDELDRSDAEPSIGADARELDPSDHREEAAYPPDAKDQAIVEDARRRYAEGTGGKVIAWAGR